MTHLLTALLACVPTPDGEPLGSAVVEFRDDDLDGFAADEDCNEADPRIHPGAAEACDGVDQDCDGLVDEGLFFTLYLDSDGDGAGDPEVTAEVCTWVQGWVDIAGDCDDSDPDVGPHAEERCSTEGFDDDCDGLVDADDPDVVDAVTYYYDDDGDGFGGGDGVPSCFGSLEAIPYGGDCDDLDPMVHPAADEVCDALGIDEDCDGLANEDDPEGPVDAVAGYPDLDGDGYGDANTATHWICEDPGDLVHNDLDCDDSTARVGPEIPEQCGDGIDNDCSGVFDDCGPGAPVSIDALSSVTITGTGIGELGRELRSLDFNGDGMADLAVSSRFAGWYISGQVQVFSGPVYADNTDAGASVTIAGAGLNSQLGSQVEAADMDGDGYDDLVVAARQNAYIVPGPISGSLSVNDASAASYWLSIFDFIGDIAVGDLNGDGQQQVVVGMHGVEWGRGAVFVDVPGSGAMDLYDASTIWLGTHGEGAGERVAVLDDADGDGLSELVVGAPASGRVSVATSALEGGYSLPASADARIDSDIDDDELGSGLADAGDLDGDGRSDLLVAAPRSGSGLEDDGVVYVLYGPITTDGAIQDLAAAELLGSAQGQALGAALAEGHDLNGDGRTELVVGATGSPSLAFEQGTGSLHLFYGPVSGAMQPTDADVSIHGEPHALLNGTGLTFLADQDGDGRSELAAGGAGEGIYFPGVARIFSGDQL